MSDAHQVLSYTISADDRASTVFRGVSAEIGKLQATAKSGLGGIAREMTGLGQHKPLELIKNEQYLAVAKTEAEMKKLSKTVSDSGVATKLQSAELAVLTGRHQQLQKELDKTTAKHQTMQKAATTASVGILAAGGAVVVGAIKQGIAWEDLQKKIEQQTGLSGKNVTDFMKVVNNVSGNVQYRLNEISEAAVLLHDKFGLSNKAVEAADPLMVAFAKRLGEEVNPAVVGLMSVMTDYRKPLGDVTELTDELTSVSQKTQRPMSELLGTVEKYGPKFQARWVRAAGNTQAARRLPGVGCHHLDAGAWPVAGDDDRRETSRCHSEQPAREPA